MKQKIYVLLICLVLVFSFSQAAFANEVSLVFNGKNLSSDVAPVIKSGRTLVPVRVITESLGADVDWDQAARKVTIIKHDSTIELTIDQPVVYKDGTRISDLDVPAQITGGRTMVPIRFISENFGATVKWDGASRVVSVDFEEKLDGMTPEELMLKTTEAMQKYNTYKFRGAAEIKLNSPDLPQELTMEMTMEGSYKKNADKAEVYTKQIMELPVIEGAPITSMTIEVYSDGSSLYQRINGSAWTKLDIGADILQSFQNQDPQTAIKMMQDFGLILAHGNEAKIDGKACYTLLVKIDSEKYKEFIREMLNKSGLVAQAGQTESQVLDVMLQSMKMDLSEKIYIEKDTFITTTASLAGTISMTLEGQTLTEDMNMNWQLYDLGATVTMPVVE